jgi:hypothetical protein
LTNLPFAHRENLSPEDEKIGIEFYTAGKVDGGRETLRRITDALDHIELPDEFKGYLPEGWDQCKTEVMRVLSDIEEKYKDPFFVTGQDPAP